MKIHRKAVMGKAGIRRHLMVAQHSCPGRREIATVMIHCTIFLTIYFFYCFHTFFLFKISFFLLFLGFNNKFKNFMKLKHFCYDVRSGSSFFSRPISLRFCKTLKSTMLKKYFFLCRCLAMLCKISFDISHDTSRRKRFFFLMCDTTAGKICSLSSLWENFPCKDPPIYLIIHTKRWKLCFLPISLELKSSKHSKR